MRVLQVVNDFFPEPGGVQRSVLELSKALLRRGAEVKIISTTRSLNQDHGAVEGVPVAYAGHIFKISQAQISLKLVRLLLKEKADVVHTHLPYPWSADWAASTGKLRRRPIILTYHNDIVGPGWKKLVAGAYGLSLLQITLSIVNQIVVTTPERASLSPILQRFANKVVQVPLGVDIHRFRPLSERTDGNTIGFLALLRDTHRQKGLDVLLEAMRVMQRRPVSVRLKVGGGGDLLPYYQSLAQEMGVKDRVEFAGFIPEDKLAEFYNSVDVFVLPSLDPHFEGFGLVASEALACGRPVITTTAAGIAPLISESGCGLVVPPGDPLALADGIQKLLGDPIARLDMGQRGRSLAERLSWDKVAETYEQLYAKAISSQKTRCQ